MKTNMERIGRIVMVIAIVLSYLPVKAAEQRLPNPAAVQEQSETHSVPSTYTPPNLPAPDLDYQATEIVEHKPTREEQPALDLRISAGAIDAGGNVTIDAVVKNNLTTVAESGEYLDMLEPGLTYLQSPGSPVEFDLKKNEISLLLPPLQAGQEYRFSYQLHVNLKGKKEILVHTAELENNQTAEVVIGGDGAAMGWEEVTTPAPARVGQSGWKEWI